MGPSHSQTLSNNALGYPQVQEVAPISHKPQAGESSSTLQKAGASEPTADSEAVTSSAVLAVILNYELALKNFKGDNSDIAYDRVEEAVEYVVALFTQSYPSLEPKGRSMFNKFIIKYIPELIPFLY